MKAGAWERTQAGCDARRALLAHGRHAAGELCRSRDAARRVSGQASVEVG